MGITIQEALLLPALKEAVLVAGKGGINRIIESVNMMEVPDIIHYVKKDEFLVTTTYPIRDNPQAQELLIPSLVQKEVAALAIKPVFYSDEIPPIMIRQADELDFPLIKLPKTASFNEILNPVLGEILNRQAVILRKNEEVHQRFTELVLKGGTLEDIARMLAMLENNPVSIHTPRFVLLAFGTPDAGNEVVKFEQLKLLSQNAQVLSHGASRHEGITHFEHEGTSFEAYVHHMLVAGEDYGFLILWLVRSQDHDINVIEQAVTVIALELMKRRAIADVERRFKSYFIEEIIQGKLKSRTEIISRGRGYGWDLSAAYLPILIEIDDYLDFVMMRKQNRDPVAIQKLFWNIVSKSIMFHTEKAITVDIGARILILLRCEESAGKSAVQEQAKKLGRRIQEEMSLNRQLTVTIGIGRIVLDVLDLGTGYTEAEKALEIGRMVWGPNSITLYDDLSIYRLIDLGTGRQELAQFCRELLGDLVKSDQNYHTEFMKTLEILFESNFNLKKAAEGMNVHYNTMRYRISKIEQLASINLDSEEDRFNLQLAYKIYKIAQNIMNY